MLAKQNAQQQSLTIPKKVVPNSAATFQIKSDQYDQNRNYFLNQYFYNTYNGSNRQHPIVNNGINITRIEVWETNVTGAVTNTRNVVGFMDMGESKPYETSVLTGNPVGTYPSFASTTNSAVAISNNLSTRYCTVQY